MFTQSDDSRVTETVEIALRSIEAPVESFRIFPVENVWETTHGKCLELPEFHMFCPLSFCRFHVQSDMRDKSIRKQISGTDTCVLRLAHNNPHTLDEVGRILGFTRERSRQIELKALERTGKRLTLMGVLSPQVVNSPKIARNVADSYCRHMGSQYRMSAGGCG